jgi:hypothetical protein
VGRSTQGEERQKKGGKAMIIFCFKWCFKKLNSLLKFSKLGPLYAYFGRLQVVLLIGKLSLYHWIGFGPPLL